MKFEKGKQKTGGRSKGVGNKSTKELQDRLKYIIDENLEILMQDFRNLDSLDRVKTLSMYLKYVMPSMKESNLEVSVPEGKVNLADEKVIDSIISSLELESKSN